MNVIKEVSQNLDEIRRSVSTSEVTVENKLTAMRERFFPVRASPRFSVAPPRSLRG